MSTKRPRRHRLLLLALLGCGCSDASDASGDATAPSPRALFVDMDSRWSSPDIPICWANPDAAHRAERDWVQSAVKRTWEAASRVRFTGWGPCVASDAPGIHIRVADERPHTLGLGRELDGAERGMTLNFAFARWNTTCADDAKERKACVESIAVHEFGHALGFDHEQDRPDTPGSCRLPSLSDLAFGDFDGDGRMDVFRSDGNDWQVTLDGGRTWTFWNTSVTRAERLQMSDFDGDGTTDVFRATGSVWQVSRSGTGRWQDLNSSSTGLSGLGFGDFNGDGRTDVFRADGAKWYVSWSGTSAWQVLNTSATPLAELRFGDFDGDGKTDVFRTNGSAWFMAPSGSGRFQPLATSAAPLAELRFGDFDGDGKTDVFHASGGSWRISAGGASSWKQINTSAARIGALSFGHLDGDSKMDVFHLTSDSLEMSSGGTTAWRAWKGAQPSEDTMGDLEVGAWDAKSVMNYCNQRWNNDGVLSPTDAQGVRQVYGAPL